MRYCGTASICCWPRRRFLALSIVALALAPAHSDAASCRTIYVAGHIRHASIIVDRRDFDPLRSLGAPAFLSKDWLEFGWGDADFYQAKGDDVLLGLKALLLPTDTVVHVHGFNGSPASNFPKSEVIELHLADAGYAGLLGFLRGSFARDAAGKAKPLGPGLYGLSEFYEGTGTYSLFNTCNTWAARALAAGGFPIDPDDIGTVTQFLDQVRGRTVAGCPAVS
jgi:uncharacterized protein (TIGR02117 family)